MPEQANQAVLWANGDANHEGEELRLLSRTPHPYHRQNVELLDLYSPLPNGTSSPDRKPAKLPSYDVFTKESTPTSGSGTEADDEHFLKGLPAPRPRHHKGLRARNDAGSGYSTPLLTPELVEDERSKILPVLKRGAFGYDGRGSRKGSKQRKEVARRSTEVLLLGALGGIVCSNTDVRSLVQQWRKELFAQVAIVTALLLLYPIRLVIWAYRKRSPSRWIPMSLPSSFDPAPILYPFAIPLFASLLIAANTTHAAILPNLILSICSLPKAAVPAASPSDVYNPIHWILSCIPMFVAENSTQSHTSTDTGVATLAAETGALIYPLHQTMCMILHYLTTTSLLPAELQLLSVSLTDLLLLSTSPQAVILQAVLWVGGIGLLVTCSSVLRLGITLARVPKWRFRRPLAGEKRPSIFRNLPAVFSLRKLKRELMGSALEDSTLESGNSSGEHGNDTCRTSPGYSPGARIVRISSGPAEENAQFLGRLTPTPPEDKGSIQFPPLDGIAEKQPPRRHTLPAWTSAIPRSKTHTPSGRRKRATSSSVRVFFTLTQAQAEQRRWLYAGYLYSCILAIILVGIREYVGRYALNGEEPVGWALGYLFGGLPWFRFQVVKANLERWICLPPRSDELEAASCHLGWVEHLRYSSFGAANTRLILSGYWLAILVTGLAIVFQLSPIYEVDTRRKVFHFMMVAMLLPATFVDPTFAALALVLILAIFLLLDLVRSSQLPPASKAIANFLTPYVDGRDLRGPVVISHIFLLIGCAIPLWLSLACLPRTGDGFARGWDVAARDASMVSGVVCVGLGDAAASLIGRRWGHRKWRWGGGKSLEGSLAFASAVFVGLLAAAAWLRVGGWQVAGEDAARGLAAWDYRRGARNAAVCGTLASLTEAVLTGGNDNVVVPVMLWTCVKSLGV